MSLFDQLADRLRTAAQRRASSQPVAGAEAGIRAGQAAFAAAPDDHARSAALSGLAGLHERLGALQPAQAGARAQQAGLLYDLAEVYHARSAASPPSRPWAHGPAPDVVTGSLREMAQTDNLRFHRTSLLLARKAIGRGDPRAAAIDLVTSALAATLRRPGTGQHHGQPVAQAFTRLRPTPAPAPPPAASATGRAGAAERRGR
ncbi:hypothetical protein [Actinoplanes sp. L3-i22]|uniref:hypothetical protein n=1 Tax=Actinoplanes sp. L3-i22 TaxID=2836373 RepID=UPI001C78F056|nr:hypothetical protein [Actinoplanes sp. L3-i22]BCY10977.1 hypothetical protein L3i22_060650 [Actinoplanes sp. L3-i22]